MALDDLPTIPASWTAPTSCFASTNYYRVLMESGYFSNMYGTPTPVFTGNTPSGDCFPPSFTISVPYLTDGDCPTGYTKACATAGSSQGQSISTVICCPSVTGNDFSFMCRENEYNCHATATENATWTGVITNIGLATPTEEPVTREPYTEEGCEAWGIKFISVSAMTNTTTATSQSITSIATTTSTSESSTATATESTESASTPLASGTIAGIVVGAALGVALLGVGAFFFRRRRQKRNAVAPAYEPKETPRQKEIYQLEAYERPALMDPQDSRPGATPVWELHG
ncbi:hypothetical protein B0T10DRAFT_197086 [Thelonectria olida]|uniref:Uncharacterized protein n=1 Tax=Thelonectria olida TaxID=1576542 RepID=A0A9P8VT02_9HYPO|nr:hypothetical protein B0T10DRAFT_197086 [Thelonectria olida]